jgi:hypothetical protein
MMLYGNPLKTLNASFIAKASNTICKAEVEGLEQEIMELQRLTLQGYNLGKILWKLADHTQPPEACYKVCKQD